MPCGGRGPNSDAVPDWAVWAERRRFQGRWVLFFVEQEDIFVGCRGGSQRVSSRRGSLSLLVDSLVGACVGLASSVGFCVGADLFWDRRNAFRSVAFAWVEGRVEVDDEGSKLFWDGDGGEEEVLWGKDAP